MGPERYLELLEQDGAALAAAARLVGLEAAIPTCPGWTVGDCVAHTAEVYQHKMACMRLQRRPGEDYEQEPPAGVHVLTWFNRSLATLLAELRDRGPAAPSYTWWPADQTVGFWYRRMAQETAVHRVDVEDAGGTSSPIDVELAVDGIDEVLEQFLGGDWGAEVSDEEWGEVDPAAGSGKTVAVTSGGRVWDSTLHPDAITLDRTRAGAGAADASVTGEPGAVLLWLWGRRPDEVVELGGDPATIAAFRDRLRIATQ